MFLSSKTLCCHIKNDVIYSIRLQSFFSTNIYSSKECNISFERAQNMLSRKNEMVFMETNNISKKNLKSKKLVK